MQGGGGRGLQPVGRAAPTSIASMEGSPWAPRLQAGRAGSDPPLPLLFQHEMLRYKEVCYYMLFALAAYGWPMYLMRKPACGLCQLARSCS